MKRILMISTGGTIACKRTKDGLKPVITSDEILSYVAVIQEEHIIFYLDDKDRSPEPVRFFPTLDSSVGLLKLIPSTDASLLDYMAEHYNAVIIESFGVGGLPSYEVGRNIKQEFGLLEAYDMTLEAVVTKTMWILGQTKDPAEIRRLFYETINRDILWYNQATV